MEKKSSIIIVKGGMHRVNVGPKVKFIGVLIVEEIILQTSVVNMTRSIRMPQSMADPYQQARGNKRGARPQGGPPNELRPPNLNV